MRLITLAILFMTAVSVCSSISVNATSEPPANSEEWRQEFADVCAKTQQAMSLSDTVLKQYIERCEQLRERLGILGGAEDSARRFYAGRLQMCMDFYNYILEVKNQEKEK